jgi:hypothetical protein
MTNPLEPLWDAYQGSAQALKVVRRCAEMQDFDSSRPFGKTIYYSLSTDECLRRVTSAKAELDDLTVVSLAAAFERAIRDHVKDGAVMALHVPPFLTPAAVADHWMSGAEDWKMEDLLRLFRGRLTDGHLSAAAMVRKYRNWVAHGRNRNRPPEHQVEPVMAYTNLTEILSVLGVTSAALRRPWPGLMPVQ